MFKWLLDKCKHKYVILHILSGNYVKGSFIDEYNVKMSYCLRDTPTEFYYYFWESLDRTKKIHRIIDNIDECEVYYENSTADYISLKIRRFEYSEFEVIERDK